MNGGKTVHQQYDYWAMNHFPFSSEGLRVHNYKPKSQSWQFSRKPSKKSQHLVWLQLVTAGLYHFISHIIPSLWPLPTTALRSFPKLWTFCSAGYTWFGPWKTRAMCWGVDEDGPKKLRRATWRATGGRIAAAAWSKLALSWRNNH